MCYGYCCINGTIICFLCNGNYYLKMTGRVVSVCTKRKEESKKKNIHHYMYFEYIIIGGRFSYKAV